MAKKLEKFMLIPLSLMGTLFVAGGFYASGWFYADWDAAGPNSIPIPTLLEIIGTLGALLLTAALVVATWLLYIATNSLQVSSDKIAEISSKDYDDRAAIPLIEQAEFQPLIDPDESDEDGQPKFPPSSLRISIKNIGKRPLDIDTILVEEQGAYPDYHDGELRHMEPYSTIHEIPIAMLTHESGAELPIPADNTGTWKLINHNIWWEGQVLSFRVGARAPSGRTAFQARKTNPKRKSWRRKIQIERAAEP